MNQTLPQTAEAVLAQMAAHAGVLFAGQVVAITRADNAGYVDIRFRVDQPIRDAPPAGAHYVLREWAGLWTDAPRYTVGQRLLMILTARSSSGFSAPVRGQDGAIPLVAAAQPPLLNAAGRPTADLTLAGGELHVDLRWLAARACRTPLTTGRPTPESAAVGGKIVWLGPFDALGPSAATAGPAAEPTLSSIVTLLQSVTPDAAATGAVHAVR